MNIVKMFRSAFSVFVYPPKSLDYLGKLMKLKMAIIIIIMTVPSALRCSATNVENNLPLMWKMKRMNRKMCRTVRQTRDLPLNIALKEVFVMIQLFSFRQKPWYFYELEDSKERTA